ncbi:MAG: methyltransferase type 12 [Thiohalocapsa sp.]|jgi:phospholipid N-methyltransferase|uniref:class I SAM-dependent methyltransferase n=1 Tax=Thiohalocapsa sp. TaxID=2497641 RepID=UPI0025D2FD5B|nr:methyltransferase type 12 [Thiohalocapsa sp.]MCG6940374.1 methyltransferase type 12 [Thiohalocapsa sp.]
MSIQKTLRKRANGHWVFARQVLQHPLQIGAIIPSSSFLERRVVAAADIASAKVVVELGPGTGGMTRAMLRALQPEARLLSIEINPIFHAHLAHIEDERLIAHLGSAADIREIAAAHGLGLPDAIVSGIPFSTMPQDMGAHILADASDCLAAAGRFVAYQFNPRVAALAQPFLGEPEIGTELMNFPPMRVFRWAKAAA